MKNIKNHNLNIRDNGTGLFGWFIAPKNGVYASMDLFGIGGFYLKNT